MDYGAFGNWLSASVWGGGEVWLSASDGVDNLLSRRHSGFVVQIRQFCNEQEGRTCSSGVPGMTLERKVFLAFFRDETMEVTSLSESSFDSSSPVEARLLAGGFLLHFVTRTTSRLM